MKYKIYQRFTIDSYHTNDTLQILDSKYGLALTFPERLFIEDKKYLSMTYEGEIFPAGNTQRDSILGQLYMMFNMDDRPTGRYSTSLSIGDVVMLNDEHFVCASFGFEKVEARKYKSPSELTIEGAIELVVDEVLRLIKKKMNGYYSLNEVDINKALGDIHDFEILRINNGCEFKVFIVSCEKVQVEDRFRIVPVFRIENQYCYTGKVISKLDFSFTPEGAKSFMDELFSTRYKIVFYYSEEKDALVCLSNNKIAFIQEEVSSTDLGNFFDGNNIFDLKNEEIVEYLVSEIVDGLYNGNTKEDNDEMLKNATMKDYPITMMYSAFTLTKQRLNELVLGNEAEYIKSLF